MWVAKNNLLPLDIKVINNKSVCLVILPINSNLVRSKYLEIKQLQYKMLSVLKMPFRSLNLVNIFSDLITSNNNNNNITKKFLFYYQRTKLILQFGNLDILDINYLNMQNIIVSKVVHPEQVLQSQDNKKQAYQDLLLCRAKLQQLL